MRFPPFQFEVEQKKLARALLKQFSPIISVIIGSLFLAGLLSKIGFERWLWAIYLAAIGLYAIFRQTRREVEEKDAVGQLLEHDQIIASNLPLDFRFITKDTTLQKVFDKAGPCSERTTEDNLVFYEYDLPYHASVLVFPEPPYTPESKIRTAYFRRPREDDDSMAL